MRQSLLPLSLILLAVAVPTPAFCQGADSSDTPATSDAADSSELFLNAYMANEQGEKLENSGDNGKALEKFRYAASLLDQISRDDPKWQPIVVDFRKKKVSQNISALEQQIGSQGADTSEGGPGPGHAPAMGALGTGPDASAVPLEGALPEKEGSPMPNLDDTNQEPPRPAPPAIEAGASQAVRDQFDELETELRESRQKLKSVETEKEGLAGRLDDALRQIDQIKVSEAELKGQLKQAQDAYQNSSADHSQTAGSQKQIAQRITQLQNALKDAEADRDAADEENADYNRRAARAKQAAAALAQQRDAANAHAKDIEAKYADTARLAAKLDAANRQISALTKDRDDATQRADDLDKQLASTSKLAARLADAQKQIAALKAGDATAAAKSGEVAGQLADARKQIDQITADRDTARAQVITLNGKLADAQTLIVSVKADRDQIAAERDKALADLGKAREAEKRVDQLLADNTSLTKKLAADETIIKDFKSDSPGKDKQIADLRKQVSDTQALLASSQQERDNIQSSLNDLQQQYDSTSAQLTELKAGNALSSTERKTLTDENGLLRGIVIRELKQEARRDETKRLVMSELSQLRIQSDTLLDRIKYLGEPVIQLDAKEKALFKDPSLDIPDASGSSMDISIAAPKQTAAAPVVDTVTGGAGGTSVAAGASPSATPMDMAKLTSQGATGSPMNALPPAPATSPAAGNPPETSSTNAAAAPGSGGTMVPPELMDDAKSAKEAFERSEYLAAEKIYEKMLIKAPNNVYILSNLGVVYFRNEKWKLAEESLKKAIAIAPDDTFSWCTLGIVYYQEKRFDDAINALTRALAINPRSAVAHNYLGITASQKGWQEAAVKELLTAIELDPKYADACFNLAVVYAMQQPPNKEDARKYYKRATDLGAPPDEGLEQLVK